MMDNLLTVAFEAHSQEKNHHRRYQITVGRDLLRDPNRKNHYSRNDYKKMRQMSEQARDKNA